MLIRSKNSKNKVVHIDYCGHIKNTKNENRVCYYSYQDALADGCTLCKHCSSIARQYNKEKEFINAFCKEHQMIYRIDNIGINIISAYGKWYLVGSIHKQVAVHHESTFSDAKKTLIKGYHYQKVKFDSIAKALDYIHNHDMYRKANPIEIKKPKTLRDRKTPTRKGTHAYEKEQRYNKKIERLNNAKRIEFLFNLLELQQVSNSRT